MGKGVVMRVEEESWERKEEKERKKLSPGSHFSDFRSQN